MGLFLIIIIIIIIILTDQQKPSFPALSANLEQLEGTKDQTTTLAPATHQAPLGYLLLGLRQCGRAI